MIRDRALNQLRLKFKLAVSTHIFLLLVHEVLNVLLKLLDLFYKLWRLSFHDLIFEVTEIHRKVIISYRLIFLINVLVLLFRPSQISQFYIVRLTISRNSFDWHREYKSIHQRL